VKDAYADPRVQAATHARVAGAMVAAVLALLLPAATGWAALLVWPVLVPVGLLLSPWPGMLGLGFCWPWRENRWRRAWWTTSLLAGVGLALTVPLAAEPGLVFMGILPFTTLVALVTLPVAGPAMLLERRLADRPRLVRNTVAGLLALGAATFLPALFFGWALAFDAPEALFGFLITLPVVFAILLLTWRPTRLRTTGTVLDAGGALGHHWIRRADGVHWVSRTERQACTRDFRPVQLAPDLAGFTVKIPSTRLPLPIHRIAWSSLVHTALPLATPWLVSLPAIVWVVSGAQPETSLAPLLVLHHLPLLFGTLAAFLALTMLVGLLAPLYLLQGWVREQSGGVVRLDGRTVRTADGVFHLGQDGERITVEPGLLGMQLRLENATQRLRVRGAAPELHAVARELARVERRGDGASVPASLRDLRPTTVREG
jgi:hypothetical protein